MADIVKSVEFFELTNSTDNVEVTLSKGQDPSNCVPFLSVRSGEYYQSSNCWDVTLSGTSSSGTINFDRWPNATGHVSYVNCYLVEFDPDEVYVESGTFDCSTSQTDTVTTSGTFNPDRTAMVHWWQTSTQTAPDRVAVRGRVVSSGTLDFYRYNTADDLVGHWYIFEASNDQYTVEHIESTGSSYAATDLTKSYDYLKTFVIASNASAYSYPQRAMINSMLRHRGCWYWQKYTATSNIYAAAQILEFQDNKVHVLQAGDVYLDTTTANVGVTWSGIGLTTTSGFSMITRDVPYFSMSDVSTITTAYDSFLCTAKLDSGSTATIERESMDGYITKTGYYVVDWKGHTIDVGTNGSPINSDDSFVKSVQNSRVSVEEYWSAQPLTKGQSYTNCAVFASQSGDNDTSDNYTNRYLHDVYLSDTNMIVAGKSGRLDDGSMVDASVVEFYSDQVRVQQGTAYSQLGSTEFEQDLEYAVDADKAFILSKVISGYDTQGWYKTTTRVRFVDSDTLGFYRHYSTDPLHISWFVVEDITTGNSCFDVYHWTGSTGDFVLTTASGVYSTLNSFNIISGASTYTADNYVQRNCFRSNYKIDNAPQIVSKFYDNTTYYAGQVVRIRRAGRKYTHEESITIDDSSGRSYSYNLPTVWSGSSDITVFNNTNLSFGEGNPTSQTRNAASVLTTRIVDYDSLEVEASVSMLPSAYIFNFNSVAICWPGTNVHDAVVAPKSKSCIKSIQVIDIDEDARTYEIPLSYGQDGNNCVPFATWHCLASGDLGRVFKFIGIKADFGLPHHLTVQTSDNETIPTTNGLTAYVVEFDDRQVKVQHGAYASDSDDFTVKIGAVDTSKAFIVFYNSNSDSSGYSTEIMTGAYLQDSTTIRFRRYSNSGNVHVSWFVVECLQDQWEVTHLYDETLTGATSTVAIGHVVDPSKTLVLSSYSNTYGSAAYTSYWAANCYIDNNSDVIYDRYSSSQSPKYVGTQIIEFKDLNLRVLGLQHEAFNATTYGSINVGLPGFDSNVYNTITASYIMNNVTRSSFTSTADGTSKTMLRRYLDNFDTSVTLEYENSASPAGYYIYPQTEVLYIPDYNGYYYEGYTKEQGSPVSREVFLYRTDTGDLMDTDVSDESTGYFYLETSYSGVHHVVCLDDDAGLSYNHLIYGKTYPTVISGSFAHTVGMTTSGLDIGTPSYLE